MNIELSLHENLPWRETLDIPLLRDDEVHIWCAKLDQSDFQVRKLNNTLTVDERARAGRFYFAKDKQHFIVSRGLLRLLLGRYMRLQPDLLRFTYNRYGKPALKEQFVSNSLCFNLARSRELVYYVIARGRKVGADVEYVRSDIQVEELARQFFSPRETSELLALPVDMRLRAFFNCWTRKEAYIKATGAAFSYPLSSFDVSFAPGAPAKLLATVDDPEEASRWTLRDLPASPGYVAAMAYEGPQCHLICCRWPL